MSKERIGIFGDPSGDTSSKRVCAVALIFTGLSLSIFCVITRRWEGWQIISLLIGSGLALYGVTVWSERRLK